MSNHLLYTTQILLALPLYKEHDMSPYAMHLLTVSQDMLYLKVVKRLQDTLSASLTNC
jgi:hypothetical protein